MKTTRKKTFKYDAEEARRLLEKGYTITLFIDGLDGVTAIAVKAGKDVNKAIAKWQGSYVLSPFKEPNLSTGGGRSVAGALHAVASKKLDNKLPTGETPADYIFG